MKRKKLFQAACYAYKIQKCLKSADLKDFVQGVDALVELCSLMGGVKLMQAVKELMEV